MERLADSINDTARMARASLVLVMLMALYLSLTLLSSTDEQLLRESDVAVPQINIGISIKTNYTIGPLIFLYLHLQTLFLLSVLARKIRRFTETSAEERHWNWLSAFIFVQLFRPIDEHSRITFQIRRWLSLILCCISIAVIPIFLLIVVDLSFARYQSSFITTTHHWILALDIISVILFSIYIIWLYRIDGPVLILFVVSMLPFLRESILLFNVKPLQFDISETANDRIDIWKKTEDEYLSKNLLGFVLCDWLDISCGYYIDVNGELLANPGIEVPDDAGTKRVHAERLDLAERELRYACFRSAELHHVDLRSADLRGADFGSAKIQNSSNLSKAKLHGVNFTDAKLNGIDISKAKLHSANLSGAELRNANISGAELYGANLSNTQGIGTKGCVPSDDEDTDDEDTDDEDTGSYNKSNTILHGADLRFAKLRGVNLEGAELHGANLSFAKLWGVNLRGAELYGADLRNAKLYGVNLEDVKLDGSDLGNAKLSGSFGAPKSWNFVWMPNASFLNGMEDIRIYREEESVTNRKLTADDESIWKDRSEWAADFACRDEYNARIVLKRWNSETPLSNIKPKNHCMAISTIVRALNERKEGKKEECFGLHTLPNDEWLEFLSSTRNRMEQLKEELIHGQCVGIPKTDRRVGR